MSYPRTPGEVFYGTVEEKSRNTSSEAQSLGIKLESIAIAQT